ncbi:MAG: MBL fold metallo-hydrolase, partial [Limnochordia bacterium]
MSVLEIKPGVHWVGSIDWNIRYFHGPAYSTHRGTTYNAYLVIGEKTALIDTVYTPFADELVDKLKTVLGDLGKIDYIVVNHVEMDHSGALPKIKELCPQAPIICSPRAVEPLQKHFDTTGWEFQVVKTGDSLDLGGKTLSFIEAPMLHW